MSKLDEVRKWLRNVRQEPAKFSVRCDETGFTQIMEQGDQCILSLSLSLFA